MVDLDKIRQARERRQGRAAAYWLFVAVAGYFIFKVARI